MNSKQDLVRELKDKASKAFSAGKWRDAHTFYADIVALDPREVVSQIRLGDVHLRLGQKKEALAAYERGATSYAEQGDLLKAIAVCKLILAVDAAHTKTQEILADLYARRSMPVQKAAASKDGRFDIDEFDIEEEMEVLHGNDKHQAVPGAPAAAPKPAPQPPNRLARIPLFSDLPKNCFIEMLTQMRMREMKRGERVITQGEVGDSFFVIASGSVRIKRTSDDGTETEIGAIGEGGFFGEMALLQDGARTASVLVDEDSQILEINKSVLRAMVAKYPSVDQVLRQFYKQRVLWQTVSTHPLFRPLDLQQRRELMQHFRGGVFRPGDTIVKEGTPGEGLYLLQSGSLQVKKIVGGEEVVISMLHAGAVFGEMSLLIDRPTTATVIAMRESVVLQLARPDFQALIAAQPKITEIVKKLKDEREENDLILFRTMAATADLQPLLV